MTIEEAIEVIEYARAFNEENTPLMKAWDLIIDYVRAQQEAEKNEQPVLCSDCMYWEPTGALGGPSIGEIERIGKCWWIRGGIMASDFCSKGKRRSPVKEET